jgi:hypothetical protein
MSLCGSENGNECSTKEDGVLIPGGYQRRINRNDGCKWSRYCIPSILHHVLVIILRTQRPKKKNTPWQ